MSLKDKIKQNESKNITCKDCKHFEMLKECGYCNKKDKLILLEYPPNNIEICFE